MRIAKFFAIVLFSVGCFVLICAAGGVQWGTPSYGFAMFMALLLGIATGLIAIGELS